MTTRRPAGAKFHVTGVIDVPNINVAWPARARPRCLRMAAKAEIRITNGQQLRIDGAVRIMAGRATFPQRRVLKREWPRLFAVALRAIFIQPRHRQSMCRLPDIHAVRIVALNAIHFPFEHRVMLWKMKFRLCLQVTCKTSLRVLPRINNELSPCPTRCHMLAGRAMA